MSDFHELLLKAASSGTGYALDLGGGYGILRKGLEAKGYSYVNVDMASRPSDGPLVLGDAHRLPFTDATFELVVSNNTFEHFLRPDEVVLEARRVLREGGQMVIQVPFMHPFHGNDTYRYTPLGLRYLLSDRAGLEIVKLESPLWIFSIFGFLVTGMLGKVGLRLLRQPIRRLCMAVDSWFTRRDSVPRSFAAAYVAVARKRPGKPEER